MAVFLINICKFNGCGITFPSLGDLIQHIEDTHIDYDPKVVEQKEQAQPACLPLSYVLRFISDAARKESPFLGATGVELKRKLAIKHHSYSLSSSNRSNTPTGSELDEDEMIVSESEDSNDSWTTEEFSSEFIMRYGSRHSGSSNGTPGNEKPFACPVPGCKKRYKNVNGIKYHSKNGHKKDGKVRKGYKCHCGKSYKTAQGLKSHALVAHNASPDNVTNVMVRSTSPSQSLGSLSPSSISNMSSSNGSCNNINQTTNSNCITQATQPPSTHQQQQPAQIINSNNQVAHLTNGGSIQQHTPVATTNSINQSIATTTVAAATNHLMRSNIGLISIKSSTKPNTTNLIAANVTASKILKLAAASAAANNNNNNNGGAGNTTGLESTTAILENGKLKFEACTTATTSTTTPIAKTMTLPNLVNLGILTPATSPNNKSQQHTTFQTTSGATVTTCGGVSVLSSLNLNSSSSSCSSNSSCSASAPSQQISNQCNISTNNSCSLSINHTPNNNNNNANNNMLEANNTSLPLTPMSPNVVQQAKTVTVASVATGTVSGGGLTISTANGTSSILGSIHLATATGGLEET